MRRRDLFHRNRGISTSLQSWKSLENLIDSIAILIDLINRKPIEWLNFIDFK